MTTDTRFEELVGRLLDDELTPAETSELIDSLRDDPSRQNALREQLEAADLISQAEDDLRRGGLFVEATRSRLSDDQFLSRIHSSLNAKHSLDSQSRAARWPWVAAAASLLTLIAAVTWSQRPKPDSSTIARITDLNGSLQWIGDGGKLTRDLKVGSPLSGGTLEAVSSDSWAALEFRDGSTFTVSGPALLTFSENDQKEFHLRDGTLFARVAKQAPRKPVRIHTRTAEVEVLGTQLLVEAEASTTHLNVTEGRVRVTRLVDGTVAEVPAQHQLTASADRTQALTPILQPDPVSYWTSQLTSSFGQLIPADATHPARLHALPMVFNRPTEGPLVVYAAGLGVAQCGKPPVVLDGNSRFHIRGRVATPIDVVFGITVKNPQGGFGGKFHGVIPAARINPADGSFNVVLSLNELGPEPHGPAGPPIGFELQDCYVLTLHLDAGLEILKVELNPPAEPPASISIQ